MPHLKVYNHHLRLGGDDVSAPLVLFIIGRLMWMVILLIILSLDFKDFAICTNGIILLIYLFMTIIHLGFAFCLDCFTLNTSLLGTIVESHKRKGINGLLKVRFTLSLIQILYAIVGIVGLSFQSQVPCGAKRPRSNVNRFIFGIIITAQLLDSGIFLCCATMLIGTAPQTEMEIQQDSESELARVENRFRKFLKSLETYGCGGNLGAKEMNDSIEEVATVITKYFHNHGFLDVVPSDIVAGIILVRTEQRTQRDWAWKNAIGRYSREQVELLNEHNQETKISPQNRRLIATLPHGSLREFEIDEETATDSNIQRLGMMARCSVFAAVIYNRIIPLDDSYWNTLCKLCHRSPSYTNTSCIQLCCCCWIGSVPHGNLNDHVQENQPGFSAVDVHGLNFVGCNRIGVSSFAQQLSQTELIFISFRNDTIHKPFAIFLDHQEQYIVITIRGTLSIEDALTDATCGPTEMTEIGEKWGFDGRNRWAHAGMLRAATVMREEIEESRILYRIFEENLRHQCDVGLSHPILNRASRYGNYKLMITGHSLGAGAAIILAMLLRPRYPTLHCFGFGPPGSTLDVQTCKEVSSFATSVVLGNDIVPRISYRSLCTFRDEILSSIARAKTNKAYIMQAMFRNIPSDELMYPRGKEPDSEFLRAYHIFRESVQEQLNNPNVVEMFLPGEILHLLKYRIEWEWCSPVARYALIRGKLEDFTDIVVSTTMIIDHAPDLYHQEIHRLLHGAKNITYSTIVKGPTDSFKGT